MGFFTKSQTTVTEKSLEQKITEFTEQCIGCLADHGSITSTDRIRLRELAWKYNFSEEQKVQIKVIIVKSLIEFMIKAGYSKEYAIQITTELIRQIADI